MHPSREGETMTTKQTASPPARITHSRRIVTWQSPSGNTMDICSCCKRRLEAAYSWPKDDDGQEFCSVSRGLHRGVCDLQLT